MGRVGAVIFVANEVGVINSLNTARMLGCQAIHLIVLSRSPAMTEIAQRSRDKGIVDSVTIYRSFNNVRPFFLLLTIIFPKLFLKSFFDKLKKQRSASDFDVVFIQNMLSALIFRRAFRDQEFILVDEGLSSYSGRVTESQYRSKSFKILSLLFYGRYFEKIISRFYLSEPRMLVPAVSQDVFKIESDSSLVKELLWSDKHRRKIGKVEFCYIGVPLFGLIDLCKGQDIDRANFLLQAEEVVARMVAGLSGKLLYKKHPLEDLELLEGNYGEEVSFLDGLWEEICLHSIGDGTVLFNFFSTAATFPKLILDKEPTIVFMYRLLQGDVLAGDEIIEGFRQTYCDSSKILVPKNLEEFTKIVNDLTQRLGNG